MLSVYINDVFIFYLQTVYERKIYKIGSPLVTSVVTFIYIDITYKLINNTRKIKIKKSPPPQKKTKKNKPPPKKKIKQANNLTISK